VAGWGAIEALKLKDAAREPATLLREVSLERTRRFLPLDIFAISSATRGHICANSGTTMGAPMTISSASSGWFFALAGSPPSPLFAPPLLLPPAAVSSSAPLATEGLLSLPAAHAATTKSKAAC
jgi:hypothetical protein